MTQDKNRPQATAMQKMDALQQGAHQIGVDLADEAFLHDAGTVGITAGQLQKRWAEAYTLGRNGVEHALGRPNPYAADRIDELRADNNQTS